MLIILPPSETKAVGGDGESLDLQSLHFAGLTATRKRTAQLLQKLGDEYKTLSSEPSDDAEQRMAEIDKLVGIRATQRHEHEHNAKLFDAPTMPAILRYTGVAYDALDAAGEHTGLPLPAEAIKHLAIGSALFGVLHATDLIPHYRLSATSKLPVEDKPATMRSIWANPVTGNSITEELEIWREDTGGEAGGIIDLRSGGYRNLGKIPGAVSLRVESQYPDGSRKAVSHYNKYYKGLVARELSLLDINFPADPEGSGLLAEKFAEAIGSIAGFNEQNFKTELHSPTEVTLIVPAE